MLAVSDTRTHTWHDQHREQGSRSGRGTPSKVVERVFSSLEDTVRAERNKVVEPRLALHECPIDGRHGKRSCVVGKEFCFERKTVAHPTTGVVRLDSPRAR